MNYMLPAKNTNNIFLKLKNWFKTLLVRPSSSGISIANPEIQTIPDYNQETFIANLKKETMSNASLLQQEIEQKARDISELTNEEYNEVVDLYKLQIKETREKIISLLESKKKGDTI